MVSLVPMPRVAGPVGGCVFSSVQSLCSYCSFLYFLKLSTMPYFFESLFFWIIKILGEKCPEGFTAINKHTCPYACTLHVCFL